MERNNARISVEMSLFELLLLDGAISAMSYKMMKCPEVEQLFDRFGESQAAALGEIVRPVKLDLLQTPGVWRTSVPEQGLLRRTRCELSLTLREYTLMVSVVDVAYQCFSRNSAQFRECCVAWKPLNMAQPCVEDYALLAQRLRARK